MRRKVNSLYIHIPFCRNICPYCDFLKIYKNEFFEDQYVEQVIKDLSSLEDKFFRFKTVYIGGGTPSCLELKNIEKILVFVKKIRKVTDYEFTIEANPEDINEDFLKLIKKYGVNRISLGVQTFDKNILKSIGRDYNIDFFKLISLTKKYINNINLDFIYGLPNYSFKILKNDLSTFFKLDCNHASFYSLIVSPGTMYFNEKVKEIDNDLSCTYYKYILNRMRKNGFERYEVSNYAKKGFESKHNLTYWRNHEYIGIGAGSSGYFGRVRYENTKNISKYINGINEIEKEVITNDMLEEYYFITNLRLSRGFSLKEYKKIFKSDFENKYKIVLEKLFKNKLVEIKKGFFCCTDKGILILDLILSELISKNN